MLLEEIENQTNQNNKINESLTNAKSELEI